MEKKYPKTDIDSTKKTGVYDAAMNAPRGCFIATARVICLAEWVGHQTKTYLFVLIHQRRCCQVEHISLGCYKIDGGVVALVLMFEELGRAEGFVRRGAR